MASITLARGLISTMPHEVHTAVVISLISSQRGQIRTRSAAAWASWRAPCGRSLIALIGPWRRMLPPKSSRRQSALPGQVRMPRPAACVHSTGDTVGRMNAIRSMLRASKPVVSTLQLTSARSSPARKRAMASARSSVGVSPVMTACAMPCSRSTSLIAAQCATPMAKNSSDWRFSSSATSRVRTTASRVTVPVSAACSSGRCWNSPRYDRHAGGVDAADLGALGDQRHQQAGVDRLDDAHAPDDLVEQLGADQRAGVGAIGRRGEADQRRVAERLQDRAQHRGAARPEQVRLVEQHGVDVAEALQAAEDGGGAADHDRGVEPVGAQAGGADADIGGGIEAQQCAGVLLEQFVAVRQDQHAPAAPDECQRQHRDQHRLAPGAGRFDEGAPHAAVEGVEDRGEGFELVGARRDRRLKPHDRVHGSHPMVGGPVVAVLPDEPSVRDRDDAFRPRPAVPVHHRQTATEHPRQRAGGSRTKNACRCWLSSHARRSSSATLPVVRRERVLCELQRQLDTAGW